ncbi:MAG: hypothetical protein A2X36_01645 [Elusimicrobia bacterium GWA2_69_24]|nr:MAG: hypothetical protein A2X36_01645 [Elusimicrobia bacterium GWA2_69_24]HBL19136.1 hypothetical protein [Elusimicrobiota bacterium]
MARILVVDDEADMRMALSNVLSRNGHQVFEAADGPTGLEFLAREGADVVLLDMRLPGMDGLQILRTLRETDRRTPVIMVTGYGSVESAVEVMQLGAAHYLAKPFSNQELLDTVERIVHGGKLPEPVGVLGRRLALKLRGGELSAAEPPRPGALVASPPAPAPEGPLLRWLPAVVLLTVCLAALGFFWSKQYRLQGRDYPILNEHPTGLVWRGERLFVADWLAQSVQEYAVRGGRLEPVRSVRLPGSHITGLAVSDENLFVCDSWRRTIEVRRLDERFSLVRSLSSPGPNPSGLYWDGQHLWSSDSSTGRFYRHEAKAGMTVLENYLAPGRSPASMFKDDSFFWSTDSETRLLYRHRLDSKLRVLAVYSLPLLDRGPASLSAFTLTRDVAWLGRDGEGSIYSRPIAAFVENIRRDLQ